jgi:hypothetical protein
MKRAVLYLRVSTIDQTTANQERELREIAGRQGQGQAPGVRCALSRCDQAAIRHGHGLERR